MSDTIERLTGADYEEAMDTMGHAFGFEEGRDFPSLLPQIYRPTDEWMQAIYAIRRDGKIVSAVGCHPRAWQVGDTTLKLGGIGGVCTLHDYRGQGLMKRLMDRAVDDMVAEEYHLSWLGGQRQRYQYYGYERCGNVLTYTLGPANIRHADRNARAIRFELMTEDTTDWIAAAKAMHERRPIHVLRGDDDFILYLLSGYNEPLVAFDSNGDMLGYVTYKDGGIKEVTATDAETALDVLVACSLDQNGRLGVMVQPDEVGLSRLLGGMAEAVNVSGSGNWQIYDWETTLDALMKVKRETHRIEEGEVNVEVDSDTFKLFVTTDRTGCVKTDDAPDLALTVFEAHRLLFGPSRPVDVVEIPDRARMLNTWMPLPLGFMRADSV